MVLHNGRHDLVPLPNIVQTPSLRDKVDCFRRPSGEHDLARRLSVDERSHLSFMDGNTRSDYAMGYDLDGMYVVCFSCERHLTSQKGKEWSE